MPGAYYDLFEETDVRRPAATKSLMPFYPTGRIDRKGDLSNVYITAASMQPAGRAMAGFMDRLRDCAQWLDEWSWANWVRYPSLVYPPGGRTENCALPHPLRGLNSVWAEFYRLVDAVGALSAIALSAPASSADEALGVVAVAG